MKIKMMNTAMYFYNFIRQHKLLRRVLIVSGHIIGSGVCYYASFLLRFDGRIPSDVSAMLVETLPIYVLITVLALALFKLHSGLWSYFSIDDLLRAVYASLSANAIFALVVFLIDHLSFISFPRSVFVLNFILLTLWIASGRLFVRYLREYMLRKRMSVGGKSQERVLVVGNIEDTDLILRLSKTVSLGHFVGVVTDNRDMDQTKIHGVPVCYSKLRNIGEIAKQFRVNSILILSPFRKPRYMNLIIESCSRAGVACQFRQIPSISDLTRGNVSVSMFKKVNIEDLLLRDVQKLDRKIVRQGLQSKKVMVTGAGGSIGSELCRQIARYNPAILVLLEFSEIALYSLEAELSLNFPYLKIIPVAGDIRHPEEIKNAIAMAGGIDIIYHAAAYKHVPLMEENVPACFRNNVIGTSRLIEAAEQCKVKRFVMISSDKAVRPSNIMGATKRIAERLLMERPQNGTELMAVRFGNVLGSSGSVIPLFKKQIEEGGPVTVTSPEVRRYFMTIPEAVDLVLQAGAIGENGKIFVLEMGECVKIVELAKRMIELSGLIPDKDIKIKFIGLRPGEKEYEELITEDEDVEKSEYNKIRVLKKNNSGVENHVDIDKIEQLVSGNDANGLRLLAREYVPENTFPE
ncbi:MAG: nucleoside-diphosphate sugar epimerase/dehydratase [Victivallaceae bacterium]|jgi:FlaA1/EpsC-like NDP-sugar epimerase